MTIRKNTIASILLGLLGATPALAQVNVQPYVVNGVGANGQYTFCPVGSVASDACPIPVTGSAGSGGSSAVTITPTLPTIATATAIPTASKAGAAYVQPVFDTTTGGGKYVGVGTGLPVDIRQLNGASIGTGLPIFATALPLPANAAQETGGNLATLAGGVSGSIYQTNIKQVNGASIGTGLPIWATSLAVTSGYAQGSTTSGETLSPIGCRTLTSAPTDTTAQSNIPWCPTNGSMAIFNAPFSAGGLSLSSVYLPANNTATAIDTNPGQIYKVEAYNNNATILYLNFWDASVASVGNCTGPATAKYHMMVPANSTSGAGVITQDVFGLPFATAITECAGTVFGGTGLPTADEYILNVFYK